jgi:hypothetical protein
MLVHDEFQRAYAVFAGCIVSPVWCALSEYTTDDRAEAMVGDRVSIIHGKPFSRRKHFALQSINRHGTDVPVPRPLSSGAGAGAEGRIPGSKILGELRAEATA